MIENIDGRWFLTDIGFFLAMTCTVFFFLVLTFTVIDKNWLRGVGDTSTVAKIVATLMMSAMIGAVLLALDSFNILAELAIAAISLILAGSFGYYGGRILGWFLEGDKDG